MIVASPAYASDNPQYLKNFTRGDYHGTVIWNWQQALMIQGEGQGEKIGGGGGGHDTR